MERQPPSRSARRAGSGRFPVKVSIGGGGDIGSGVPSPGLTARQHHQHQHSGVLPPPIPSRSHQRKISQSPQPRGQGGRKLSADEISEAEASTAVAAATAAAPRPMITPLTSGSERLRSNSESILQATKNKRMGMVTRKTSDLGFGLGTVDESRSNRASHYRGLSYGSLVQDKTIGNGASKGQANGVGPSSPGNSTERERVRANYVRRLSSLPEYRSSATKLDPVVEGAKGILYSLFLVHPYISNLVGVVRDGTTKRTSLERVFYNASTHVEELDREIHRYMTISEEDEEDAARSHMRLRQACVTCVMAYQHVCSLLQQNARKLAHDADPRYVRTLLLVTYSSLVEVRNACSSLAGHFEQRRPSRAQRSTPPRKALTASRDPSATPTRERPQPTIRSRSNTASQRAERESPATAQSTLHSGRTLRPLRTNGLSRQGSLSGTITAIPASGDSFLTPESSMDAGSRLNTLMIADEAAEERQFAKIFLRLQNAYEIVLKALPSVKHQFVRCIEVCKKSETQRELRTLWAKLDQRCSFAMQMAEALKAKMMTIKIKDPAARYQREFWQLCATFVEAFVDTALLIKDAKSLELIPGDILQLLKPISKAVKEVGVHIESSPWKSMSASQSATTASILSSASSATSGPPRHITQAMIQAGLRPADQIHHLHAITSASEPSSSPHVSPIPATPLSAALGPAAQATVPSSSNSTASAVSTRRQDPLFAGNVFERADSLLSTHSRNVMPPITDPRGLALGVLSPMGSRSNFRAHG